MLFLFTGNMAVILYILLLVSAVCSAEGAVTQPAPDVVDSAETSTGELPDKLPKPFGFQLSESAEALLDHLAMTMEGQLDKLQDQLDKLVVTQAGCQELASTDTKFGARSDTATTTTEDQLNGLKINFEVSIRITVFTDVVE